MRQTSWLTMLTRSWILSIFLSSGARGTRAKNLTAVQEEHAGPSTHSSMSACRHAALGASGAVLFPCCSLWWILRFAGWRQQPRRKGTRNLQKAGDGRGCHCPGDGDGDSLARYGRRALAPATGPRLHLQLKATRPGRNKTRIRQARRWNHRLVIKSFLYFFVCINKSWGGKDPVLVRI